MLHESSTRLLASYSSHISPGIHLPSALAMKVSSHSRSATLPLSPKALHRRPRRFRDLAWASLSFLSLHLIASRADREPGAKCSFSKIFVISCFQFSIDSALTDAHCSPPAAPPVAQEQSRGAPLLPWP